MKRIQALGPMMIDIVGTALSSDDIRRLQHSAVGGVILFRRNFVSYEQISDLIQQIKSLRSPELIVAVDHEGGRVQRFIEGFTRLPAMRNLGDVYEQQGFQAACSAAEQTGWVLAAELRAIGVDLSFTPVLDLDWGQCAVIGNRSFHADPAIVGALAVALQRGLARGGMAACGKHFPGHGAVEGDSHHTLPCDERDWHVIERYDLHPFRVMMAHGLAAVMPAHVVYPQIDQHAAGFSAIWLKDILRHRLGFTGMIFSDDLTMEGAAGGGTIQGRTQAAFQAGCDVALVCNRADLVDTLLADFPDEHHPNLTQRWEMVRAQRVANIDKKAFQAAQATVAALCGKDDLGNRLKVGEAC